MNPELWESAKAIYLEAADAPDGYEAFLDTKRDIDLEVMSLVRQLLAEDSSLGPRLDRPCWISGGENAGFTLETGQLLLERFEVMEFLGAGGAGEVYRAFDREQEQVVALKTLRGSWAADSASVAMLRNELNMARQVTSPCVCRLYEAHRPWRSDAPPFVTMELLPGETLARHLRRAPVSPEMALRLVLDMISGLEAAHAKNIVHRDFKPANIMISEDGSHAVIMDFGLAREVRPGAGLEVTLASKTFAGTPAYMAPEQLRGQRATFASDIHALGVVMFEMLTGRLPFDGVCELDVAARRLQEEAPSPRRYLPGIDRRWEYAILRCLQADPLRRPRSAAEVRQMLQEPPPVTFGRRGLIVSGICAIPLLTAAERIWDFAQRGRRAVVDVYDIENISGDKEFDFVCRGTTSELIRRFGHSDHVTAIPRRMTMHAAAGEAGSPNLVIGGVLSRQNGAARLDIQISDARKIVWSKTYGQDRFTDLLGLQAEIAGDATKELIARAAYFGPSTPAQSLPGTGVSPSPTGNSTAFNHYIRGSSLQQEETEDSLRAAVGYFERALALDPGFALARTALADCHLSLLNFGFDYDGLIAAKARESAQRSVREAPTLAEAHAVMGAMHQVDWDWTSAESEFNLALRYKPDFAKAIRWRAGLMLQFARFDEAIAGMENAFRLDPYDRGAASGYGAVLIFARRFREAADMLQREIGSRGMLSARYNLALAKLLLAKQGGGSGAAAASLYADALAQAGVIESAKRRSGSPGSEMSDRLYALAHSMMDHNDLAAPYLARLERNVELRRTSPGANATIYVAQHRLDDALTALEHALILRDRFVMNLRVNILLEDLIGLPRFEVLLRTLRLK